MKASSVSSPSLSRPDPDILIGVLALQGAFLEHLHALEQCQCPCIEVRTRAELQLVDGLILPGGESTAMALVAEREGLLQPLIDFSCSNRPLFGTCAGLILMSDCVTNQKTGGQNVVGGLHVTVQRNHYGTQLGSFETTLSVPVLSDVRTPRCTFQTAESPALFIRAPGITRASKEVEVLASIPKEVDNLPVSQGSFDRPHDDNAVHKHEIDFTHPSSDFVPVAVRQGTKLATTFHPELTRDLRWHQLFINMVRDYKRSAATAASTER